MPGTVVMVSVAAKAHRSMLETLLPVPTAPVNTGSVTEVLKLAVSASP